MTKIANEEFSELLGENFSTLNQTKGILIPLNTTNKDLSKSTLKDIKNFRIISNPGCYPTSIQLPLIPLIKKKLIILLYFLL